MSGAMVNASTGALTAQGSRVLELARSNTPVEEIASYLGVKPSTVRVYFSNLRLAGYKLPRSGAGDVVADDTVSLMINLPPALVEELGRQARLRGYRPLLAMASAQALLVAIHADYLYNAVLGDLPGPRGRAA